MYRRRMKGRSRVLTERELLEEALKFKPMDEVFKPKPRPRPHIAPMPPNVRHESEVYPLWKFALGNAGSRGGIAQGIINWARSHIDNQTVSKWLTRKNHPKLARIARFVGLGRKRGRGAILNLYNSLKPQIREAYMRGRGRGMLRKMRTTH